MVELYPSPKTSPLNPRRTKPKLLEYMETRSIGEENSNSLLVTFQETKASTRTELQQVTAQGSNC